MKTIELIGNVDEQHRLTVAVPAEVPPGPVKLTVELPDREEEGEWRKAVAAAWACNWSDPREDIYTLDDGQPSR